MVTVRLVLYFNFSDEVLKESNASRNTCEALDGSEITTIVTMPFIPRAGEYIRETGGTLKVDYVTHCVKERVVELHCTVDVFQGVVSFLEDKAGWNLDGLTSVGRKLFFKEVKKMESVWRGRRKGKRRRKSPR